MRAGRGPGRGCPGRCERAGWGRGSGRGCSTRAGRGRGSGRPIRCGRARQGRGPGLQGAGSGTAGAELGRWGPRVGVYGPSGAVAPERLWVQWAGNPGSRAPGRRPAPAAWPSAVASQSHSPDFGLRAFVPGSGARGGGTRRGGRLAGMGRAGAGSPRRRRQRCQSRGRRRPRAPRRRKTPACRRRRARRRRKEPCPRSLGPEIHECPESQDPVRAGPSHLLLWHFLGLEPSLGLWVSGKTGPEAQGGVCV